MGLRKFKMSTLADKQEAEVTVGKEPAKVVKTKKSRITKKVKIKSKKK